jgi:hypothetical protein
MRLLFIIGVGMLYQGTRIRRGEFRGRDAASKAFYWWSLQGLGSLLPFPDHPLILLSLTDIDPTHQKHAIFLI